MTKVRDWSPLVAAELGHEMRNVVDIIHTLGSLLLDELPPTGNGAETLDDLLHTASRARRLAERLMQLAIDRLADVPTDLVTVIARQVATLRRIAPDRVEVDLAIAVAPGPLWTSLRAVDIEQIVFNLAHNAFDAMSAGDRLAIELSATTDMAVLTVRETGGRMDAEAVRRCFEPFFTTKRDGGAGIGLHAVSVTVADAGGRIGVETTRETGTRIAIYLPLLGAGAAS